MKNNDLKLIGFTELISNINMGIIIENVERELLFVNETVLKMLRISLKQSDVNDENWNDEFKVAARLFKNEDSFVEDLNQFIKDKRKVENKIFELKDGKYYEISYYPIKDGELIEGHSLVFNDVTEKIKLQKKLSELSKYDELTKIFNRKIMKEEIKKYINLSRRYNNRLSIILFDIDNFKEINDKYGYDVGDNILVKISNIILNRKRGVDIFGRWSGEEFVILLPETDLEGSVVFAEHMREKLEEILLDEKEGRVTASFGVSELLKSSDDDFLKRAEEALFKAKNNGKNIVVSYEKVNLNSKEGTQISIV